MKLEIETPAHLIDVNGLGFDKIENTPDGGLRIGALVRNTTLAADPRVLARDGEELGRAEGFPALERVGVADQVPGQGLGVPVLDEPDAGGSRSHPARVRNPVQLPEPEQGGDGMTS